jgi:hypothetical protein
VRAAAPHRPVADVGLPHEALYADDSDFFSTDKIFLEQLEKLIPPTIGAYNLNANNDKWERTTLTHETSAKWKEVKKLGSLLGEEEDIDRRIALAIVQLKALEKLWDRPRCASLRSRLRAYNALVLPVLLYNAGTWGVCQQLVQKLEVAHRHHLRRVLGVQWPHKISNKNLYERCSAEPIGTALRRYRWNLFGHVLRLAPTTPAQMAIDFYCDVRDSNKQRGRAHTTLPVLLFNEYHSFKQHRKPSKYRQKADVAVRELRKLASNRKGWATLVKDVCAAISIKGAVTVKAEAP